MANLFRQTKNECKNILRVRMSKSVSIPTFRRITVSNLIKSILFVFVGFLTLAIYAILPGPTAKAITGLEDFRQKVRSGLAEIDLPINADQNSIDAAAIKLPEFIRYRSGVDISKTNLETIRRLELEARLSGTGVSISQLSRKLAEIGIRRTEKLTDAEIDYVVENLRGFYAPDLPEGFKKGRSTVRLRASGRGHMEAEELKQHLVNFRDGGVNPIMKDLFAYQIKTELSTTIKFLSETSPSHFGEAEKQMTPMQAILIVYSVTADDMLAHNRVELANHMKKLQEALTRHNKIPYPSPDGHRAYGENGYLVSSPVKLLLDDTTVAEILSLFEKPVAASF